MTSVDVRFIEASEHSSLVALLESSSDFPKHLLPRYGAAGSRYRALGAWMDGQLVGVLTGSFDSDFLEGRAFDDFHLPPAPHAYIDRIHVHETARAAGVGRALVREYAGQAVAHGCTFVGGQIDLSSDATERRSFFDALGFSVRSLDNFGATPQQVLS